MVQEQVKRAFEKKASLQEMFERRRVSLKKLAAKQTRPVQPVAPRPESLSSPGIYLSVCLSVCLSSVKWKQLVYFSLSAHREHENICISEHSDSRGSCKQVCLINLQCL